MMLLRYDDNEVMVNFIRVSDSKLYPSMPVSLTEKHHIHVGFSSDKHYLTEDLTKVA